MSASTGHARSLKRVLAALEEHGLLLVQDHELPNVVTQVTGDKPRSSWWSHPQGRLVFAVLSRLAEHEDVLFTKLLAGKVTLVHRRLWPSLLTVARERAAWQMGGLSPAARRILAKADEVAHEATGKAVKELEVRLLVHTEEVHTKTGGHALRVESWEAWARRVRVRGERSLPSALRRLEDAARTLGARRAALPWPGGD